MVEFPAIFGHEGAGFVRAIGRSVKDKSLQVGDPCSSPSTLVENANNARQGTWRTAHSLSQVNHNAVRLEDKSGPARLIDGRAVRSQYFGHSSYPKTSVVKERCVIKCPFPDLLDIYCPMGCGFQTGAGTILNVLKPGRDHSLVIFGLGSVGRAALMAAKGMTTSQIIAVDIMPKKLAMAKELGATDIINSGHTEDVVGEIKRMTGGGPDFSIDCTGSARVIEDII